MENGVVLTGSKRFDKGLKGMRQHIDGNTFTEKKTTRNQETAVATVRIIESTWSACMAAAVILRYSLASCEARARYIGIGQGTVVAT